MAIGSMQTVLEVGMVLSLALCSCAVTEEVMVSNTGIHLGPQSDGRYASRVKRIVPTYKYFTLEEEKALLDEHNRLRRMQHSSDMQLMKWNVELASMAQEWAENCLRLKHGYPKGETRPFRYLGQSIWWSSSHLPTRDTVQAVTLWYNEIGDYNFDEMKCDKDKICGHFTQIVWAETTDVGCGYANCGKRGQEVICNYGPGGNFVGQVPFQFGNACSKCSSGSFFCLNALCNSECTETGPTCECAAFCQNCGTKLEDTCSCQCAAGWLGSDCTKRCDNYHVRCGNGWSTRSCGKHPMVGKKCPAMCGLCVYDPLSKTCPEAIPRMCSEWGEWDLSTCTPCGGCGFRTRTRRCLSTGVETTEDYCLPKLCIRGTHPLTEELWLWEAPNGAEARWRYISRSRKCCYAYEYSKEEVSMGIARLPNETYCSSELVNGWSPLT